MFTLSLHNWYDPIVESTKLADKLGLSIMTPRIGQFVELGAPNIFEKWWLRLMGAAPHRTGDWNKDAAHRYFYFRFATVHNSDFFQKDLFSQSFDRHALAILGHSCSPHRSGNFVRLKHSNNHLIVSLCAILPFLLTPLNKNSAPIWQC